MKGLIIASILLFALIPQISSAADRIVYQTTQCTTGDATYTTIEDAITDSSAGDNIIVCPGSYPYITVDKSLNIRTYSSDPYATAIDGGNQIINANWVNISGFKFNDPGCNSGLSLEQSNFSRISNNVFYGGEGAVFVYESYNTTIINNTFLDSSCGGILINYDAHNTTIIYNNFTDSQIFDGCSIWGDGVGSKNIVISYNTITVSEYGISLCDDSGTGANPYENLTISYNNITTRQTGGYGIYLDGINNSKIIENRVTDGFNAINIYNIFNSLIHNNFISNNSNRGISLFDGSNNTISNNYIEHQNRGAGIGLDISSAVSSNFNLVFNNTLFNNTYGIYMTGSVSNNIIYNNNFLNNTIQAYDAGTNFWNITKTLGRNIVGGPYLGGNFWTGFSETCTDNNLDGICDLSYTFDSNIDYLPLTYPPSTPLTMTLSKATVWWNDTVTAYGTTFPNTELDLMIGNTRYNNQSDANGLWSYTFRAPLELGTYDVIANVTKEGVGYNTSAILTVRLNYGEAPTGTGDRVAYEVPILIQEPSGRIRWVWTTVVVWRG